jgi:hypothetical protein
VPTKESPHVRWSKLAFKSRSLSSNARLVASAISTNYMDWETLGNIFPGVPRLADDTHLSERSVHRALKELVDAGFLGKGKKGCTGRATLYFGTWPKRAKVDAENAEPQATGTRTVAPTTASLAPVIEMTTPRPPTNADVVVNVGLYHGLTFADIYERDPQALVLLIPNYIKRLGSDHPSTRRLQGFLLDAFADSGVESTTQKAA